MFGFSCITLFLASLAQPQQATPTELLEQIRAAGSKAPAALFDSLAKQRTPEAWKAYQSALGSMRNKDTICRAYASIKFFNGASDVQDSAVEYLAEAALESNEKTALHAVLRLGELWPACQDELIDLALKHATSDGRSVAMMHLVEHGSLFTPKQISKLSKSKEVEIRFEAKLATLHTPADDDVAIAKKVAKFASSSDVAERLAAVEFLRVSTTLKRFDILRAKLNDKDPRVNRKCLDVLEHTRAAEAVGILIDRLEVADVGEAHRTAEALRRLTEMSFGTDPRGWKHWWKIEADRFQFNGERDISVSMVDADPNGTASFYGMTITAQHLVFAIDTSDSMKADAGGTDGLTRLEVARKQVSQAIKDLPKNSSFDIVNFGKSAWSWNGKLVAAKAKSKTKSLGHVKGLKMSWGTEAYKALREAFVDPRADTILLLTDGDPQLSLMQDRAVMRRIIIQWNRTRHTTIDCITIGTDRGWLRKIAMATGGRYKQV